MEYFCDRYAAFLAVFVFFAALGTLMVLFRLVASATNDIPQSFIFWINIIMVAGVVSVLVLVFAPSQTYLCGNLR